MCGVCVTTRNRLCNMYMHHADSLVQMPMQVMPMQVMPMQVMPMQQQPQMQMQMQMMVPIVPFVQSPVMESTEDVHRRIHAEGGLKSLSALQTCKIGRREKSHELRYSLAEGTYVCRFHHQSRLINLKR